MSDPSVAVQKAIYTALTAGFAASSPSINVPVYDAVPQDSAYPYVVIDRMEVVSDDPLSSRRDVRFMYLSIWSRWRGQKQVLDLLSIIDSTLHHKKLQMESGRMVMCYVDGKRTMRDSDNLTFQGAVKLRIITEH